MKTNIIFGLIIIALLAIIGSQHYNKDEQISGNLIALPVCPACPPCAITSDYIIGGTVNYEHLNTATRFVLPDKNLEIKIGKEVFTRTQLDALVPAFIELPIKL